MTHSAGSWTERAYAKPAIAECQKWQTASGEAWAFFGWREKCRWGYVWREGEEVGGM